MAQPIALQVIHTDPGRDIRAKLTAAPVEHSDAVLAGYALLQELQDRGILDFVKGLAGAGGDIVTRISDAMNTPEAIAGIRNLVSLGRIASSVDPELLHRFANAIVSSPVPAAEAPGLWTTLRRLGGKDGRRALGAAAYGLQVFGRVLISRQSEKQ